MDSGQKEACWYHSHCDLGQGREAVTPPGAMRMDGANFGILLEESLCGKMQRDSQGALA